MIKKELLTLIAIIFIAMSCSSDDDNNIDLETNKEGNVEIRSAKDLENTKLKGYKTINGNLVINYTTDVEDLSALKNLEEINGGIIIKYNNNLKSLQGLNNIKKLEFLEIENNLELTSLAGLENLATISKNLRIANNFKLNSLSSLNSMTTIGTDFFLSENEMLTNLTGLENLKEIPQIIILNNINLLSISGLEGITSSDNIGIFSNDLLTDFCSLVPFVQANSSSIKFSAGFNSYNPSLEDLIDNNCSK
ncbi:hypothetical protein EGM88_12575 [Aureibaculum marinum]|uniref:Receptor L-domain domain-containing protein n=1 Tax=Aureibaculum marinum TaxID=2487930 RepID=A0A3N4NFW1_9FLAO|nr:hypothetical protein [Aureibaculum marinum]RPD94295.1 hypothetical protein EGM88_12575 [Aureibaculum marinum]